jgi:hypothetical protein
LDQTVDQLLLPSARYAANLQAPGKNGGYTLSLHHFAWNGIVVLGRLIGARDGTIQLGPDLMENLAVADKASDDFKRAVDDFVGQTCIDAPEPEQDPIDEARSGKGNDSTATFDLKVLALLPWCGPVVTALQLVQFPVLG